MPAADPYGRCVQIRILTPPPPISSSWVSFSVHSQKARLDKVKEDAAWSEACLASKQQEIDSLTTCLDQIAALILKSGAVGRWVPLSPVTVVLVADVHVASPPPPLPQQTAG